jgi:hypothetical protein
MGIVFGGAKSYKTFRHQRAGIACALHWYNDDPCMVLFPLVKREGAAPFLIPMATLHQYVKSDGYPKPELIEAAVRACAIMCLDSTQATIRAVADVILEHVEDVIKMPEMPAAMKAKGGKPIGEIKLMDGMGRTLAQGAVDDLPAEELVRLQPGQHGPH